MPAFQIMDLIHSMKSCTFLCCFLLLLTGLHAFTITHVMTHPTKTNANVSTNLGIMGATTAVASPVMPLMVQQATPCLGSLC